MIYEVTTLYCISDERPLWLEVPCDDDEEEYWFNDLLLTEMNWREMNWTEMNWRELEDDIEWMMMIEIL